MPPSDPGSAWSAQHHGIDPAAVPLLRPWLRCIGVLAGPLVRWRVPPDVVTVAGLVFSLTVPVFAAGGWYVPAALAVLVSVISDGLDGAVAAASGRVSAYGRRLDSWCDRISEIAWWVALVASAGVWWFQAVVFGLLGLAMEFWRERTGRYGAITFWERPSRAVLAVVGLLAALWGAQGFTGVVTGWVGVGLAVVGAVQLARHAR